MIVLGGALSAALDQYRLVWLAAPGFGWAAAIVYLATVHKGKASVWVSILLVCTPAPPR
jgi:hypothetical protein